MGHSYFIWNGVNSLDMGILLEGPPPILRGEERVSHVAIIGRAGELTVTEGDDIWESYIQTIHMAIRGRDNVSEIEKWLTGSGEVTFSSQPGFVQDARVIGAVTLEKHSWNLDWWEGDVQFYCSPIKRDPEEEDIEITSSGATVTNPGDMTAYPLIEVIGSGAVTVSAGGNVLTIPELTSGWVIDSENGWILNGTTPLMGVCSGKFPVLKTGDTTVAFTGSVTKLVITPRFRYL